MFQPKERDNGWCIVDTSTGEIVSDKMHISWNDGRPHYGFKLTEEEAKIIANATNEAIAEIKKNQL